MARTKRSRPDRDISPTHPNAAAIDIGARMHVAAVSPDRDAEPVRSFGTFTGDLHRMADWLARCGVRTVAMESTGVYWTRSLRCSISAALMWCWSMLAMPSTSPAAKPTSVTPSGYGSCTNTACCGQLSAEGRDSDVARVPAPARAAAGLCRLAHPAHAKGADADECPAAPCRVRHHGRDRDAHCSRHCGG